MKLTVLSATLTVMLASPASFANEPEQNTSLKQQKSIAGLSVPASTFRQLAGDSGVTNRRKAIPETRAAFDGLKTTTEKRTRLASEVAAFGIAVGGAIAVSPRDFVLPGYNPVTCDKNTCEAQRN